MEDIKTCIAQQVLRKGFGGIALAVVLWAGIAQAAEPVVTPMPGVPLLPMGAYDFKALGYSVNELSIAGKAVSYTLKGKAKNDGKWEIAPSGTAPFVTRVVVIQPANPRNFNGTVVVEWMNVSGGLDVPVDWISTHRELVRDGFAYVGVSAQKVGVEGDSNLAKGSPGALKIANPTRYGKLSHPGDSFSFDIFSQVGSLLRSAGTGGLLGGLTPKKIVAIGESQSAFYLVTYVNAIDPHAKVYDGFIIHSRTGFGAPLDGSLSLSNTSDLTQTVQLRSDLRVPVIALITESDLLGFGLGVGFYGARQPDFDRLRIWEIAGASHADNYLFSVGQIDSGSAPIEKLAAAWAPTRGQVGGQLDKPMNNGPQHHYIAEAAIWQLDHWLRTGTPPPRSTPLEAITGYPLKLASDVNGNAKGGIRSPWVDVPTSRLSGAMASPPAAMLGSAEPFDQATLDRLYPGGKSEYLKKFEVSLKATIKAGFILPADEQEIMNLAQFSYPGSH